MRCKKIDRRYEDFSEAVRKRTRKWTMKEKLKKKKDKKERKDNVFVEWQGTRTHPATSRKKVAN